MKTKEQLLKNKEEPDFLTREDLELILDQYMFDHEEEMTLRIQQGVEKILREAEQYAEEAKAAQKKVAEMEATTPFWWNIRG